MSIKDLRRKQSLKTRRIGIGFGIWLKGKAIDRDLFIIGLEMRTDLKDKAQSISLLVMYLLESKQGSADRLS